MDERLVLPARLDLDGPDVRQELEHPREGVAIDRKDGLAREGQANVGAESHGAKTRARAGPSWLMARNQARERIAQRADERAQPLVAQEPLLVPGQDAWLDDDEVTLAGPLEELARVRAQRLVVEATPQKHEPDVAASSLDHVRDGRLDVDLGQDLDVVRVRNQEILGRKARAVRLVEHGLPAGRGLDGAGRARRVVGRVVPIAAQARASNALNLPPVASPRERGAHGAVVPGVDDERQRQRGEVLVKRQRRDWRRERFGHEPDDDAPVAATLDVLGGCAEVAASATGQRDLRAEEIREGLLRGGNGRPREESMTPGPRYGASRPARSPLRTSRNQADSSASIVGLSFDCTLVATRVTWLLLAKRG